jgi:hypothetical protein
MKRMTGGAVALFGLLYMMGAAGSLEAESIGFGGVIVKMIIGLIAIGFGAFLSGGLE